MLFFIHITSACFDTYVSSSSYFSYTTNRITSWSTWAICNTFKTKSTYIAYHWEENQAFGIAKMYSPKTRKNDFLQRMIAIPSVEALIQVRSYSINLPLLSIYRYPLTYIPTRSISFPNSLFRNIYLSTYKVEEDDTSSSTSIPVHMVSIDGEPEPGEKKQKDKKKKKKEQQKEEDKLPTVKTFVPLPEMIPFASLCEKIVSRIRYPKQTIVKWLLSCLFSI